MPHKRAKAVGKLLFFDNKTAPRSIEFWVKAGIYGCAGLLSEHTEYSDGEKTLKEKDISMVAAPCSIFVFQMWWTEGGDDIC